MNITLHLNTLRHAQPGAPNGAPNGPRDGASNDASNGASNGASLGANRVPFCRTAPFAPFSPVKPGENGVTILRATLPPRIPRLRRGAPNGAPNGAVKGAPIIALPAVATGTRVDAEYVIYRLEEAGTALLSLPHTGYSTGLRTTRLEFVRSALEGYGWDNPSANRLRPAMPDAARITRMDEALGWVGLLPKDRVVLRRIVGARCLISPVTERYLYTWRRLGTLVGADHKAVQRWHAQAIDMIVAALNTPA
jgi:hypothetical protein